MARSLSRNTQLYISTESGGIGTPDSENLFEVKVLDGYSFSQDVSNVEIGVNEAGASPVRGTLAFNTALNPVDISFSTYVRPYENTKDVNGDTVASSDCVERVLWASAMGSEASWTTVTTTGAAAGEVIEAQDGTNIQFGLDKSNNNQLLGLTLYFVLENTTYVVDDFNVSTAEVDFSIDGIAVINWSGNGSFVTEDQTFNAAYFNGLTAGTDYTAVPPTSAASFLRNKLSVMTLKNNVTDTPEYGSGTATLASVVTNTLNFDPADSTAFTTKETSLNAAGDTLIGGKVYNTTLTEWRTILTISDDDTLEVDPAPNGDSAQTDGWATQECLIYTAKQNAGVVYDIPITGATVTLENNFTYLTPEELAIVNKPLAGFAGNRVLSGSLTAYLNTGAIGSGGLLQDLLAKVEDAVTNNYEVIFKMGGATGRRVEFTLPTCQIGVPTTSVEDIISTEISFVSKPTIGAQTAAVGSFEATNELTINYYD